MKSAEPNAVQSGSRAVQGGSKWFKTPEWYEFEAATPINQGYKGLRITGFITCVSGAVVVMYMDRPLTEQLLTLLGCILYVLVCDPFMAIGALLARASRVILASVVCLVSIAIVIPSIGLIAACVLWTLTALSVVRRFNHRYLMQDTFASAKAIPDALRTAPESKAGLAWRHGGAKTVNGLAAELGASLKDHAEIKVRELTYYIGYQTADDKTTELSRKCERLRLENVMLKDAEVEKRELLERIEEMDNKNRKDREKAHIERSQFIKKIKELEYANAELARSIPDEVQMDDVDSKLEYAFKTMHMSDREAAEFSGCDKSRAWRYRKENGIQPKGGNA